MPQVRVVLVFTDVTSERDGERRPRPVSSETNVFLYLDAA